MISLNEKTVSKSVIKLSEELGGKIKKDFASCKMTLENSNGNGTVTSYNLYPGLAAISYNIIFFERTNIDLEGSFMDPLYFIFCLKGQMEHRFSSEEEPITINNQQNVIITSKKGKSTVFTLPANTKIEASIIYIYRDSVLSAREPRFLRDGLSDILTDIDDLKEYRYMGQIRPKLSNRVELLIHHQKEGAVGRLLTEAAILQILSYQLEYHDQEIDTPSFNTPLRKEEVKKVLKLAKNLAKKLHESPTIDDMSQKTGLNPSKLQTGFKYLFNMTINSYHKNLRLDRALDLLENSDKNISEIVYSVGLSSRSYFSRIFKERYGLSPTEYRESISGSDAA